MDAACCCMRDDCRQPGIFSSPTCCCTFLGGKWSRHPSSNLHTSDSLLSPVVETRLQHGLQVSQHGSTATSFPPDENSPREIVIICQAGGAWGGRGRNEGAVCRSCRGARDAESQSHAGHDGDANRLAPVAFCIIDEFRPQ